MSNLKKELKRIKSKYKKILDNEQPTTGYWTNKDGQKISIKDMDDKHLLNTIRYLRRRNYELGKGSTRDKYPVYRKLRKEATRRGLSC